MPGGSPRQEKLAVFSFGFIILREFGLCTLPSSEPRTSARSETWSGSALPKVLTRPILLKCYVFQHFYWNHGSGTRFFTKSLKRRAPTAAARLVCVELVASETPERRRSTFLKNVCFLANENLDYSRSGVSLAIISLTTSAPMLRGAPPARPFTHFCEEIC